MKGLEKLTTIALLTIASYTGMAQTSKIKPQVQIFALNDTTNIELAIEPNKDNPYLADSAMTYSCNPCERFINLADTKYTTDIVQIDIKKDPSVVAELKEKQPENSEMIDLTSQLTEYRLQRALNNTLVVCKESPNLIIHTTYDSFSPEQWKNIDETWKNYTRALRSLTPADIIYTDGNKIPDIITQW
ncbi:MAG: hypothetical protein ACP5N3_02980 [Candidatus Nanoarchaeia archaeon]